MEKVCGYKGLNGNFYLTKKEVHKADIKYQLDFVQKTLNGFQERLSDIIFQHSSWKLEERYRELDERIKCTILKLISEYEEDFLKIIYEKEELSEKLDELREMHKLSKNKWIPWWLKIVWWKIK